MIDPRTPVDDMDRIVKALTDLSVRLERLESPSGTSVYRTVAKLTELVNNIQAKLDEYNAARYTNAQIDAKVASPGPIAPTTVTASGAVIGNTGRFNGGLASTDVYSRLVTGGGAYRATWTHESGFLGYAPSSRRFKIDIENFDIDLDMIDDLVVRRFHYIASNPYDQAQQPWAIGLIAEEVEAIGLGWLIDYDDRGKAFGIKYEILALALIPALQRANARVAKQGFREVTKTLSSFSVLGSMQEIDVVWPEPFADANYSVAVAVAPPTGLFTAMNAVPVPGTRTATGVKVRVTTSGVAINAGATLVVTGTHL